MTSETDYHQFELKDQKRPIRPKSIKLTDDGRSRKKSKFKVIETLKNGTEKKPINSRARTKTRIT